MALGEDVCHVLTQAPNRGPLCCVRWWCWCQSDRCLPACVDAAPHKSQTKTLIICSVSSSNGSFFLFLLNCVVIILHLLLACFFDNTWWHMTIWRGQNELLRKTEVTVKTCQGTEITFQNSHVSNWMRFIVSFHKVYINMSVFLFYFIK